MSTDPNTDRQLLFGLLALQNDLISRAQLISAFAQWTRDKTVPLDEILVCEGTLGPAVCDALRQMVKLHVRHHDQDPHKSLLSLPGNDLPAAKQELETLGDTDLQQSMATIPNVGIHASPPPTVGRVTSCEDRFRILHPLPGAYGGMGEISVALDEELGRQVALKQILADKADQAFFRQKFMLEAEITGNLEHPGIVPVYGLGTGTRGRPYYAMRLVHGDNLNNKIKQLHSASTNPLAPSPKRVDYNSVEFHGLIDRLVDVAQAIRYAHSRGVLHRDLKPGNILVGAYGETLVIDWGLARLLQAEDRESEAAMLDGWTDAHAPLQVRSGTNVDATLQGQLLGTLGYAPPEQLDGRVHLISQRSDVYALGAILYQILVGEPAFKSTDNERDLDERIKDTIAGQITPPREIDRTIPKSLSAICMKALQREPADRYESAEAFVEEIERWKADQPVAAAPDSTLDRLVRLARRHRAATMATAVALVGIALVAGSALIAVNRARVNEKAAREKAELLADEKTKLAQEKTELAQRNQEVVDSFVAAFRSADPANEGVTGSMTALQVLEQALAKLSEEESDQDPLTNATLLNAIGSSLHALGAYDEAIAASEVSRDLLEGLFGAEHPETMIAMTNLAVAYHSVGRWDEAISLYEAVLKQRQATLGSDNQVTLLSMNNLALAYQSSGRHGEALKLLETTLKLRKSTLGPTHSETLRSMSSVASAYRLAGRLDEAIPLYEATLRLTKEQLGPEHPSTLLSMSNLALAYSSAGRLDDALPLSEATLELRRRKLGPEHPETLLSMNNLASSYESAGRFVEAVKLYEDTLKLREAKLGRKHPDTLLSMQNLAAIYGTVGRLDEAIAIEEATLKLRQAQLGQDHPDTLASMNNLAFDYQSVGRLGDAIPFYEATIEMMRAQHGPEHPNTFSAMSNLAFAYQLVGRLDEAIALHGSTLNLAQAQVGSDHPHTLAIVRGLQEALLQAGQFQAARTLAQSWIALVEQQSPVNPLELARAKVSLAEAFLGMQQHAAAAAQIEATQTVEWRDDFLRMRAKSIRGEILARDERWREAEPLLIESAKVLFSQIDSLDTRVRWYVPRTCERVIAMYTAWGKVERVQHWQARLTDVNAELQQWRRQAIQRSDVDRVNGKAD